MRSSGASESAFSNVLQNSLGVAGRISISGGPCGSSDPQILHRKQVCKSWRRELEARGFCSKTVQLCSALVGGGAAKRRLQNALRRLKASTGDDTERALDSDGFAFLTKLLGWKGSLQGWLQAASQEPDESRLSRGAASTAQSLGLQLVQWVGKPQGRYPVMYALSGHAGSVRSVAISRDGKRVASASFDKLVKIWNAETGAEVSIRA